MKRLKILAVVAALTSAGVTWGESSPVTIITADELKEIINNRSKTCDLILIDVREGSEVEEGIIASPYCKPYHLALNSGVLHEKYTAIPAQLRVMVYCRTGNRSLQAATFLVENGFTRVYSMAGGINDYTGDLYDSLALRSLTMLPEPSCFDCGSTLVQADNRRPAGCLRQTENSRLFILNGQSVGRAVMKNGTSSHITVRKDKNSSSTFIGLLPQQ